MQKLSSCPGFRKTAQSQAGGGSRAFPIYSAVTAKHIALCCPWLTGRAELEGFLRHHCSWEIASRLCGTRAGQEQSENNSLCAGGRNSLPGWKKWVWKCAPRCFTAQESSSEPVNNHSPSGSVTWCNQHTHRGRGMRGGGRLNWLNFWDRALREQELLPSTVSALPTLSFPGDAEFPLKVEEDVFHSD